MPETDPITSQFGKIWGIINPAQKNNIGTGGNQIANEPVTGDSLTQFLRSDFNNLADVGQRTQQQGENTLGAGINALSQPFDYWSAILSGDPGALAKAIGPTVGAVDKQYSAAERGASQSMAKGGFRSATMANLPFEKAGKISDSILSQQGQAATQLTGIGSILGQFGMSEEQLSSQLMSILTNGQLQRRQQNNQEDASSMQLIGSIFEGLGSVAGGFAAHSDRKLKTSIRYVGMENGHRTYSFVYTFDHRTKPSRYVGVMSDQVRLIDKGAVIESPIGDFVNYDRIGVRFRLAGEGV